MIKPEKRIEELISFNDDMDVSVYYVNPKKMKAPGMLVFNKAIDDFEIYIGDDLQAYCELKVLAHETGHIRADFSTVLSRPFVREMGENRAENWACTYIIKYTDLVGVLKKWHVTNDFEAAAELHVDVETLRKATRRYELEGRPVKQWQFRECWGT